MAVVTVVEETVDVVTVAAAEGLPHTAAAGEPTYTISTRLVFDVVAPVEVDGGDATTTTTSEYDGGTATSTFSSELDGGAATTF